MRYPWLGINYASGLNGYTPTGGYPTAQVAADLQFIQENLTNKIRVSMPDWNFQAAYINQLHRVIEEAKARGMYVTWGITSTNTDLTTSNWPSYQAAVLAQAEWAASVGLDEFFIGNELDRAHDGSLTDAQQRTRLRQLATAVKQAGVYTGPLTLSVSQGWITPWYTEGIGDLDSLGLDLYVPYPTTFESMLKAHVDNLGDKAYLAEWNIVNDWTNDTALYNDEQIAELVAQRADAIQASGISSAYYFTFEHTYYSNLAISDNVWALRLHDGSYRRAAQPLARTRRWFE